jgi:two-component system, NtrC family, sensor kinase
MELNYKSVLLCFVILFTIFKQPGLSQDVHFNYNYDSLVQQLSIQNTDPEKIKILVLLIDGTPEYSREPHEYLVGYLEQLIELNKRRPVINIQPYVKMHGSFIHWRNKDYEGALSSIKQSVDLFDQEKKVIAPLLTQIRVLYNLMNKQEERFEFYSEKLDYYLLNGPVENTAACYHGIAGYYNYKADYNHAISNYLRAAPIFKTFWQYFYRNELAVSGVTYKRWGNYEKALYYLNIALPLLEVAKDSGNIAFCLGAMTEISMDQKKYDQAIEYADSGIRITYKTANSPIYTLALMYKANVYLAMEKPTMAYPYLLEIQALIDKFHFQFSGNDGDLESDFGFYRYYMLMNDQKTAADYLLAAYNKAVAEEVNIFQLKYLKELASFYEEQQPALSMKYISKYFELQGELEKSNQKFKVAQYEIEQKELEQNQKINTLKQEREIQEATLSQRNTILWISLIALFIIAVTMVFLYRQLQLKRRTLQSLRNTQRQLIMAEKMASLGELTAGIAHEIQNPLNFVNNFAEVSIELIDELKQESSVVGLRSSVSDQQPVPSEARDRQPVLAIMDDLKLNLEKINHHGKRADAIVKGMLQHSRTSTGQKEPTDINELADEYFRLAYHGLRAKDKDFSAVLKTDFDTTAGKINIIPQDIGRVILNLITNAFYAVDEKKKQLASDLSALSNLTGLNSYEKNIPANSYPGEHKYEPTVSLITRLKKSKIEISVRDNGNGIPHKVLDKIFQPFFTTKPTGQGTGLGLSLSYDIVKAHGGELKVETTEGIGTEFIIVLPTSA